MLSKTTARTGFAVVVVLLVAFFAGRADAQLTEATLKGVVTDGTARVIPGSPVVAKNEATGQSRSTVTDGSGTFVLPELAPGDYTISASVPGFKSFEQKGLRLSVGQATDLHIQLQIGDVSEVV